MQQVGARESLSHDIAGLHQLESELEGIGVVQPAAYYQRVIHEAVSFGAARDFRFESEGGLGPLRNARQIVQGDVSSQRVRQHVKHQQLAGVCLGGRDAFFPARMYQKNVLREAR